MVIISTYVGDQKHFNRHWCPLMYKHQECQFYITAGPNLVYPKDLKNLHINSGLHITGQSDGPILKCPIASVPLHQLCAVVLILFYHFAFVNLEQSF